MAAQLAALAEMPMATELQVTLVEDPALDEYRQVLAAGFGEGPRRPMGAARLRHHWTRTTQSMAPLRRPVADDPAATASTLLTDSTVASTSSARAPTPADVALVPRSPTAMRHAARTGATFAGPAPRRWGSVYERPDSNHLLHPALRAGRVARPRWRTLLRASPIASSDSLERLDLDRGRLVDLRAGALSVLKAIAMALES